VTGLGGPRRIALADLYRLPGSTPQLETTLEPGELITAVTLPPALDGAASHYRKVRDRASYAFALVSVAALLRVEEGRVSTVRVALGGVAPRPWRAAVAESLIVGRAPTDDVLREAARAELAPAEPLSGNGFKVDLAVRTMASVLALLRDEQVRA
jgi:xanthine dehydrogenase YagS FAD-binding subunit